jgi:tryptophan 2,3-dioxygenase
MDLLPMLDADAFLRLRGLLAPASGSQSLQFRLIEAMLGTGRGATAESVMDQFDDAEQRRFRDVLSQPSLHDVIAQALQHQWQRWRGRAGVHEKAQRWNALLDDDDDDEDSILQAGKNGADFEAASASRNETPHETLPRSCTLMALLAMNADSGLAAMRDCLLALVAFEDLLLCWRERHAQAVHALLDNLPGTGGTSGYRYLRAAMAALPRSALHTLLKLTAPRLGLLPSSGTAVSAA